ncbi:hypothetical protein Pyn_21401 [Prunus yedoensis var. nudiflora]|uniref:Uncharacterized protein n=1 Tax=Prunus yedoensis var. nudiflora TaxID=2094558 RepID=A0A314ZFG5_PRUYE|nr:hypothetical protein Pyn_21401 [Prunus yedoensis var. nudiflora]
MENVSNLYANTESQGRLVALGEWFVRLGANTEFEGNIGGFTSNANGMNIPSNEDNSNRQGHGIVGETNFTTASFEFNANMMNSNTSEAMSNLETHEAVAELCVSCGSTSTNRVRKKKRGINRLNWGRGILEILQFNKEGLVVAPADQVAQWSRYLGMLAHD